MSRRDRHFQELLDGLRRQIDSCFAPGQSLPSKRELASAYHVGETTVHRALQILAAEGSVRLLPNVGSFRAGSAAGRPGSGSKGGAPFSVGLMTRHSAEEWPKFEIYPALLEEARKRKIKVVSIPNPRSFRATRKLAQIDLDRVPWNSFDVGLLVEAQHTISLRDPRLTAKHVLAVDQDATEFGLDSVTFSDAQAGIMVARYLMDLGHTRMAVTDDLKDPARVARRHGYEAAIGYSGRALWRMQLPVHGTDENHRQSVKNTVLAWAAAPPPRRPTALFVIDTTPILYGKLLEELSRHNLLVPRDISIVVVTWNGKFFGGAEPRWNGMNFTRIDFDLSALVRRTFDAAAELAVEKLGHGVLPYRPPRLYLAPALLIPGQSTARQIHG